MKTRWTERVRRVNPVRHRWHYVSEEQPSQYEVSRGWVIGLSADGWVGPIEVREHFIYPGDRLVTFYPDWAWRGGGIVAWQPMPNAPGSRWSWLKWRIKRLKLFRGKLWN